MDDCSLITDVYDPVRDSYKTRLHIYPNPTHDLVVISLPQYIVRESKGQGLIVNTIYYKWSPATLQVIDLTGRIRYSQEVNGSSPEVRLDTRSWKEGLYMARLVFKNETVASAKFMVLK